MHYFYVYLILSQNRLVITKQKIDRADYHPLLDNNGGNEQVLYTICKMFCLGYISGSISGRKIVNDPSEFS